MSLYLNMANTLVKIWGKLAQYALQILDFTLNMPHEFVGPVASPPYNIRSPPPPGLDNDQSLTFTGDDDAII